MSYSHARDPIATHNERTKLFAGFVNAIAIGLIAFAVLRPLTSGEASVSVTTFYWTAAGFALHAVSHYILRYLVQDAAVREL